MYNIEAAANQSSGNPMMAGDLAGSDTSQMFGQSSEPLPTSLDPAAAAKVERHLKNDSLAASQDAANTVNNIEAQNQARASMGLPPLPVPGSAPALSSAPQGQAPQMDASAPTAQPQASNSGPSGTDAYKRGLDMEANAVAESAQKQAALLNQAVIDKQTANTAYWENYNKIEADILKQRGHIEANPIDAERYLNSRGTGTKIMQTIGLILGGMGGGRGDNPALGVLKDLINRDVDAQKAELGKKENLLSLNLKRMGNLKDAMQMTTIQNADILSNKLAAEAARAQDPIAKARALQAKAQIDMQVQQQSQALAVNRARGELLNGASESDQKALDAIRVMQTVDPKQAQELQNKYVPGMGLANTEKDAIRMKEVVSASSNTGKGIEKLLQLAKTPGASLSPTSRAEGQTIASLLVGSLNKQVTGGGPMSEKEQELVRSIAADPTKIFSLNSQNVKALETLRARTNDWVRSEAQTSGLKLPGSASPEAQLSPQQKIFLEWSRRNPNTPDAQTFFKKMGVR